MERGPVTLSLARERRKNRLGSQPYAKPARASCRECSGVAKLFCHSKGTSAAPEIPASAHQRSITSSDKSVLKPEINWRMSWKKRILQLECSPWQGVSDGWDHISPSHLRPCRRQRVVAQLAQATLLLGPHSWKMGRHSHSVFHRSTLR
jgi:hypothetical protein